jgi:hypothetical protein
LFRDIGENTIYLKSADLIYGIGVHIYKFKQLCTKISQAN